MKLLDVLNQTLPGGGDNLEDLPIIEVSASSLSRSSGRWLITTEGDYPCGTIFKVGKGSYATIGLFWFNGSTNSSGDSLIYTVVPIKNFLTTPKYIWATSISNGVFVLNPDILGISSDSDFAGLCMRCAGRLGYTNSADGQSNKSAYFEAIFTYYGQSFSITSSQDPTKIPLYWGKYFTIGGISASDKEFCIQFYDNTGKLDTSNFVISQIDFYQIDYLN